MPPTQFGAHVRRQARIAIIDLRGELEAGAETALYAAYDLAERSDPEAVLINFSQMTYINSAGVALIIELLNRSQKSRRPIVACNLSPHYTKIFQITRIVDYLTIYPNEEQALNELLS